ncbi:uncharacterized protein EAF02_002041 [Botrytis sinoallii]|uniref:uncharacterized protein n=1 Tax=Botrytis sinoallii TaxID=1463999 RepID=UPI001900E361|nr:uncharacterized protein EAF02_002041 [Botrytis sinoallii]KAF7889626.1 hypothetical protein EAF02_002041 [Botrytis sinoallii]
MKGHLFLLPQCRRNQCRHYLFIYARMIFTGENTTVVTSACMPRSAPYLVKGRSEMSSAGSYDLKGSRTKSNILSPWRKGSNQTRLPDHEFQRFSGRIGTGNDENSELVLLNHVSQNENIVALRGTSRLRNLWKWKLCDHYDKESTPQNDYPNLIISRARLMSLKTTV